MVAIAALIYFSLIGVKFPSRAPVTVNTGEEQPAANQTPPSTASDEDIDRMLNDLDADASAVDQGLNDTPIDVMAE
ncbi:MAG: hypothetical protein PHC61_03350 [Chitinivibrionales bacterium]|nr:hypothetical protein [Chitinivibrionales bacterium]